MKVLFGIAILIAFANAGFLNGDYQGKAAGQSSNSLQGSFQASSRQQLSQYRRQPGPSYPLRTLVIVSQPPREHHAPSQGQSGFIDVRHSTRPTPGYLPSLPTGEVVPSKQPSDNYFPPTQLEQYQPQRNQYLPPPPPINLVANQVGTQQSHYSTPSNQYLPPVQNQPKFPAQQKAYTHFSQRECDQLPNASPGTGYLPPFGTQGVQQNSIPSNQYLPPFGDKNIQQNSILSNQYLPPFEDQSLQQNTAPSNQYLPSFGGQGAQQNSNPTGQFLPPLETPRTQLKPIPSNQYLPPFTNQSPQSQSSPSSEFLLPFRNQRAEQILPPSTEYLPPVQNDRIPQIQVDNENNQPSDINNGHSYQSQSSFPALSPKVQTIVKTLRIIHETVPANQNFPTRNQNTIENIIRIIQENSADSIQSNEEPSLYERGVSTSSHQGAAQVIRIIHEHQNPVTSYRSEASSDNDSILKIVSDEASSHSPQLHVNTVKIIREQGNNSGWSS